jgi:hypothetical protein
MSARHHEPEKAEGEVMIVDSVGKDARLEGRQDA